MESLTVSAAAAAARGRLAAGVVIKEGQVTVHAAARIIDDPVREAAVYRALVYGLERARRMGATVVRVVTDEEGIVAHLEGRARVAPSLTGPYLQARAMMNAFRYARLDLAPRHRNVDAVLAAQAALGLVAGIDGAAALPLWTAADVRPFAFAT